MWRRDGRTSCDGCESFTEDENRTSAQHVSLRRVSPQIIVGTLAGALAALLAGALGIWDVLSIDTAYCVLGSVLAGAAVGSVGRSSMLVAVNVGLFATYGVVAFSPLARHLARQLVRHDPIVAAGLDAIVVLSSSVLPDSAIDAVATERLLSAVELWRTQGRPQLVTTRVVLRKRGRLITSDVDQGRLLDLAGARPFWAVIDSVGSTRDEAAGALRLMGPGLRIGLVTSPMHTRRACRAFEVLGFYVYCVPARERSHATVNPGSPSDRLRSFRGYLYERAAMARYRWKKWA
jgi:uncharacterized SAM-binding protein YcdF (DUF218 family)